jgi:two-component system cell cycle sensor histidine kinase PleC
MQDSGLAEAGEGMTDTPQLAVENSRDGKLALDQLALALRNLRPHPYLMPIFALAVCAIYSPSVPLTRLAAWYAVFVACLVPLAVVLNRFFARERAVAETRRWLIAATATYALSTLAWVTQPIFLWSHSSELNHLMMILFLAGYLSGQSPFVAPSKALTASLFVIEGIALVATPLRAGGFIYEVLSIVTFFYAVYTVYMSREIYYSAKHMLNLQHDKTDLIAELANAKTESDRARYRAEAASRSKSQFLANMSHELRTPLNAIIGFSEVIASGAFVKSPEKHVEYSELIYKSGHHLLALINDILDLAKIEAGALVLRENDIDIGRLIGDETTLLESKAEASGIKLQAQISDAIPLIYADERSVKQIVLNLLSNAIKFTPAGGSVTAFAEVATGAALAFGVVDTGVGIAPEDQEKVFENFGQGRHDVATADKGTGLGLAIVKGLIDAHGGRVTLESKVGEGTRVTVYLPNERARPRLGSIQAA